MASSGSSHPARDLWARTPLSVRNFKGRAFSSGARRAARLANRLDGAHRIALEYPPTYANRPRYGWGRPPHPRLAEIVGRHDDEYSSLLGEIGGYGEALAAIAKHPGDTDVREPAWINGWLSGLDAASLYALVSRGPARRYIEIGSGNSTKFVARAKRDRGLATEITSLDPFPRTEIDALCDRVIRQPLEEADLAVFDELGEGDVLFFDGSHAGFMNSDVTVFFLDVLPRLAPGVIVGVHDVYLPDDYPLEIADRYYSEQYFLAAYLLAEGPKIAPFFPCHYVSQRPDLAGELEALWSNPALAGVEPHGVAFWSRTS